jgi:hypothetical protein
VHQQAPQYQGGGFNAGNGSAGDLLSLDSSGFTGLGNYAAGTFESSGNYAGSGAGSNVGTGGGNGGNAVNPFAPQGQQGQGGYGQQQQNQFF